MIRITIVIFALLIAGAGGYYIIILHAELETRQASLQQRDQQIAELQYKLQQQVEETEFARFANVDNRKLFAFVIAAAEAAKQGSPLWTLASDNKLRTLRASELEEIAEALQERTPLGALEFIVSEYTLTEHQATTLAELLGRRKTLHQDAPGTPVHILESLKENTLTENGLGDVRLGMTPPQVSEKLGVDIEKAAYRYGDEECYSRAFGSGEYSWLLRFITSGGTLGKIDVYSPGISTDRGIEVGSAMQEAIAAYPEGKLFRAHDPNERVWHIALSDEMYLSFQGGSARHDAPTDVNTVSGKIRAISLGIRGVGSVEGCL